MKKKILRIGLGLALVLGLAAVLPQTVAAGGCDARWVGDCRCGVGGYSYANLVAHYGGQCPGTPDVYVYQNYQWYCTAHSSYHCENIYIYGQQYGQSCFWVNAGTYPDTVYYTGTSARADGSGLAYCPR